MSMLIIPEKLTGIQQVRHVFAGTAARTMSQILIHPIDTIKTRLQVILPPVQLRVILSILTSHSHFKSFSADCLVRSTS